MGDYTLELYKVLRFTGGTLDDNGDYTGFNIGLHDYPIWDANYRDILNRKIVNRYLNREIGMENIERWVHRMRSKMHEIMPPYVELFNTTLLDLDPTKTVDIKTLTEGVVNSLRQSSGETDTAGSSESTTTATAGSKNRQMNLDFPQFALAENADYATSGADSNAQNTSSGTSNISESGKVEATDTTSDDSTTTGESRTVGYQGVPADLILAARSVIINIDIAIIEDLSDLFMLVWENGEEWTPSNWRGLTL